LHIFSLIFISRIQRVHNLLCGRCYIIEARPAKHLAKFVHDGAGIRVEA
jgi:hypothetical protein